MKIGDSVENPKMPEWGAGIVRKVSGDKLTIFFPQLNLEKTLLMSFVSKVVVPEKPINYEEIKELLIPKELKVDEIEFWLSGKKWRGWKFDTESPLALYTNNFARTEWRRFHAENTRLFQSLLEDIGSSQAHEYFVIPGLPTLDIVELAKVGTHNSSRENEWIEVRKQLETVMGLAPFEITFADSAGLEAEFIEKVRKKSLAKAIREAMPFSELDADDQNSIRPEDILENNRIKLWWD